MGLFKKTSVQDKTAALAEAIAQSALPEETKKAIMQQANDKINKKEPEHKDEKVNIGITEPEKTKEYTLEEVIAINTEAWYKAQTIMLLKEIMETLKRIENGNNK